MSPLRKSLWSEPSTTGAVVPAAQLWGQTCRIAGSPSPRRQSSWACDSWEHRGSNRCPGNMSLGCFQNPWDQVPDLCWTGSNFIHTSYCDRSINDRQTASQTALLMIISWNCLLKSTQFQKHPKEVDHCFDWKIYKAVDFPLSPCPYRSMEDNKLKWSSVPGTNMEAAWSAGKSPES